MPVSGTVNLFPSSTVTNQWSTQGNGSLEDIDGSNYLYSSTDNQYFTMEMDDLDSTGLNIGSITGIQPSISADCSVRSTTAELTCDIASAISTYFQETIDVPNTGTQTTYDWTERKTSDGSNLWNDTQIDGIRLKVTLTDPPSSGFVYVTYMKLTVSYIETLRSTYTSDDNIVVSKGILDFKSGLTEIKS